MADTPPSEDSVHAIFLLLLASYQRTATKPNLDDFMVWFGNRVKVSIEQSQGALQGKTNPAWRREINPFAIEFFSQEILDWCGISTAPAIICSREQARALGPEFVLKTSFDHSYAVPKYVGRDVFETVAASILGVHPLVFQGARQYAMERSGRWVLAVRIIPDAASMDFISRKLLRRATQPVKSRSKFGTAAWSSAKCEHPSTNSSPKS